MIVSASLIVLIPDLPVTEWRILAAVAGMGIFLFVVHGLIAIWGKSEIAAHGAGLVFPGSGEIVRV